MVHELKILQYNYIFLLKFIFEFKLSVPWISYRCFFVKANALSKKRCKKYVTESIVHR